MRSTAVKFLLLVFAGLLICGGNAGAQLMAHDKHVKVSLRKVGHHVLLQVGDSSSRVLPIKEEDNQYRVNFDTEFGFQPEDLVQTIDSVVKASQLASHYFLEIEECSSGDVVYSYEMLPPNDTSVGHCRAREVPVGCYSLVFTLPVNDDPAAMGSTVSAIDPQTGKSRSNQLAYPIITVLIVISIVAFLAFRKKPAEGKENPNLIQLGKYQFDTRTTELLIDKERIELTGKEALLLNVLYDSANSTLEREVILNKVWGDEGDYVGRTLDVFISKLRKKLDADPDVRIVNIRGVGYKLVVEV